MAIEIVSPGNSKRDLEDKFTIYEEAGVKEYWIVQPYEKTLLIYILNKEGKYIGLKPFSEYGKVQSVIFEGLKFELKTIFDF